MPRWKCLNCGRISYGHAKNYPCPYCEAPAKDLVMMKDEPKKEEKREKEKFRERRWRL